MFPPIPVEINGSDLALPTIIARPPRFAISGRVVDAAGTGVEALPVRLSGDATAVTATDTAGHYRFDNLPSGDYGVHPGAEGFSITPAEARLFLADTFAGIDFHAERLVEPESTVESGEDPGSAVVVNEETPDEPPEDPVAQLPVVEPEPEPIEPAMPDDEPVDPGVVFVDLPGGAMMEMVYIEPGTFTMGSPESEPGRSDDEGPRHQVAITEGFYLGRFEITESQWESVMERPSFSGAGPDGEEEAAPAVFVSWNDVQEFIENANQWAGEERFRLPTEAEWEYAARSGSDTRYWYGDGVSELADHAWYATPITVMGLASPVRLG